MIASDPIAHRYTATKCCYGQPVAPAHAHKTIPSCACGWTGPEEASDMSAHRTWLQHVDSDPIEVAIAEGLDHVAAEAMSAIASAIRHVAPHLIDAGYKLGHVDGMHDGREQAAKDIEAIDIDDPHYHWRTIRKAARIARGGDV